MGEFQLMGFCVFWSGMRVCIGVFGIGIVI